MVLLKHKFDNLNNITSASIKFWQVNDQTGFYNHNTAQVISNYLHPLRKNVEQINVHNKIKPICSKLIFKKLLLSSLTECKVTFSIYFFRHIGGCTMDWPLSVTFRDIYMIEAADEVVAPFKIKFYRRYVDDIFNWQKKIFRDIIIIKTLDLPSKSIQLNSTQNQIVLMVFKRQCYTRRQPQMLQTQCSFWWSWQNKKISSDLMQKLLIS